MASSISPSWTSPAHPVPQTMQRGNEAVLKRNVSETVAINSPLLFKLFNNLPDQKHSILDLSRANPQSLNFYADYHCKLYLTNSLHELSQLSAESIDTPHKWHRALVSSLGFYKQDKTGLDISLLWGLPNYLDAEKLKGLVDYLLPQVSEHAILHMYIYNSEQISRTPADYRINTDSKVLFLPQEAQDSIACPCYNLRQLEKLLNPFRLEHSVMLSSGIQEYLFQLN